MKVYRKVFYPEDSDKFAEIYDRVAAFATSLGKDNLISVCEVEHGDYLVLTKKISVWYWSKDEVVSKDQNSV